MKREELNKHLTDNVVQHVLLQNNALASRLNTIERLLENYCSRLENLEKKLKTSKTGEYNWDSQEKRFNLIDELSSEKSTGLYTNVSKETLKIEKKDADELVAIMDQLDEDKITTLTLESIKGKLKNIPDTTMEDFCIAIGENEKVTKIDFKNKGVDDKIVKWLLKELEQNASVTQLDLSDNPDITNESVKSIVEFINGKNTTLQT